MFKLKGLKDVERQIKKIERGVDKETDKVILKFANEILSDALSRVPVNSGKLKASAFVEKIEGGYTVGFSAAHAPYTEFGGGAFVEVPTGFEDFAMEFFVNGLGRTHPQPFLLPAYLAKKEAIIQGLSDALTEFVKR